eukprot:533659-Pyramimonas_sp.AAC.1
MSGRVAWMNNWTCKIGQQNLVSITCQTATISSPGTFSTIAMWLYSKESTSPTLDINPVLPITFTLVVTFGRGTFATFAWKLCAEVTLRKLPCPCGRVVCESLHAERLGSPALLKGRAGSIVSIDASSPKWLRCG